MTTDYTDGMTFLGREVTVKIDRPLGSSHPKHPHMIYPVNYGYIPGTRAPDGEELDAYVLGVPEPIETFTGTCIALLRRTDDNDDKLIIVPRGKDIPDRQIKAMVHFQEQFFSSVLLRTPPL